MNAKEYLMQIRKLDNLIKHKQTELTVLKSQSIYPGICYEERVQTSAKPDSKSDLLIKIVEYENEIKNDVKKLLKLKKEIMSVIDRVNDGDMVDLLYRRYISYRTWEEIAVGMDISIRHVYRIHGQALLHIGKILGDKND